MTRIRDLADSLVHRIFDHDPFLGSSLGVREYDAAVPDLSPEARQSFADAIAAIRADGTAAEAQDAEDRIIRGALLAWCDRVDHRRAIAAET